MIRKVPGTEIRTRHECLRLFARLFLENFGLILPELRSGTNQPNMLCNIDSNASRDAACSAWRGSWKQMDQYIFQDGTAGLMVMCSLADSMTLCGRNAQLCPAFIMPMMVDRSGAVQIILGCSPAAARLSRSQRFCMPVS